MARLGMGRAMPHSEGRLIRCEAVRATALAPRYFLFVFLSRKPILPEQPECRRF
jgi:hypothetical protein